MLNLYIRNPNNITQINPIERKGVRGEVPEEAGEQEVGDHKQRKKMP